MAVAVGFETSYRRIWRTNIAPDLVICPSMDPHRSCNNGHECGQIVGAPAGPPLCQPFGLQANDSAESAWPMSTRTATWRGCVPTACRPEHLAAGRIRPMPTDRANAGD